MNRRLLALLAALILCLPASAQKWTVSTNAIEWINFATINLDVSHSVAQHVSLNVGARWNPWEFKSKWNSSVIDPGAQGTMSIYNKQITAYFGMRYWPWYVYSGWWIGFKAQYSDYSRTGLWRPAIEQGTGLGAGFSVGYTWMITKSFNIEAGIGAWGGYLARYNLYCCEDCMRLRDSGPRPFFDFDDLYVSLIYVF